MNRNFDFVFTNKPVNGSAAAVLCKGEHFDPDKKPGCYHSLSPLDTLKFTGLQKDDLTGRKFGKFKVIGFVGKGAKLGRWLVKCQCGMYEIRTGKTLKNYTGTIEARRSRTMCHECAYLEMIKTDEYKNRVDHGNVTM